MAFKEDFERMPCSENRKHLRKKLTSRDFVALRRGGKRDGSAFMPDTKATLERYKQDPAIVNTNGCSEFIKIVCPNDDMALEMSPACQKCTKGGTVCTYTMWIVSS